MRQAQLAIGILIATRHQRGGAQHRTGEQVRAVGAVARGGGVRLRHHALPRPADEIPAVADGRVFVAYLGQFATNLVFGSYASGFGGGSALMLFAMVISLRPNTPPTYRVPLA